MKALRLDGIPVHALLVHFPVAAWTGASALALAAAAGGFPDAAHAAYLCNAAGLLTGLLAVAAGILEFTALPRDEAVRAAAANHLMLACTAWTLYAVTFILQAQHATVAAAAAGTLAFAALMGAGHSGARLVFHHRLPRDD